MDHLRKSATTRLENRDRLPSYQRNLPVHKETTARPLMQNTGCIQTQISILHSHQPLVMTRLTQLHDA